MKTALIGYTGFVGSNLANQFNFDYKYKNAYKKSGFTLNTKLKEEYGNDFNSKNPTIAVDRRGIEIAGLIFDIYHKNLK